MPLTGQDIRNGARVKWQFDKVFQMDYAGFPTSHISPIRPDKMTLLLDALEQTLAEPQSAHRWHRLARFWFDAQEEAVRQSVVQRLTALPESEPRADILRFTFLAGITGEHRFNQAAAARLLAMAPDDIDRLAAFMAFFWLDALQKLQRRDEFVAQLTAAQVPAMAARLAQQAVRRLPPAFPARASEEIERVAVVLPYVGNRFHTPSVMAVEQAAVLAREGRKVHLFSAQELAVPEMKFFRGDGGALTLPPLDMTHWARTLPAGVGLTVADSRFSMSRRWQNMLPLLADFNPDAVLLVGLFSPLAAALHAVRPVVGLSVNSVPPIAPADVWLTADPPEKMAEAAAVWGGVFPPQQPVFHPYRVRHAAASGRLTRTEFGLNEKAVIWVTAGFRLQHEVGGEWAARMLEMLSHYPDAVWLLVGGDGKLPQALLQAPAGRVRALPTRSDIMDILRICDIYVNPPRMGGGFSVAEAMAEGLPVTAFAGSDGGDKVGEGALPHMDAYTERLAALTESSTLRAEVGRVLRQRFDERFDLEASGPALLAACRQAAGLARKRFTESS